MSCISISVFGVYERRPETLQCQATIKGLSSRRRTGMIKAVSLRERCPPLPVASGPQGPPARIPRGG